ncbi:shikimate dehydrogenase family protein [Namhaeicola litoreus]|uniref:Shikimate dehydrogenase family protein n=1 Tax=Namhaeicola litoreus TaxID=1052145 RepID=A0ABW3Y498_9FLAO
MENDLIDIKKAEYLFGLLGRQISYSFSKGYFNEKFKKNALKGYYYTNFDLDIIDDLPPLLDSLPNLKGFNVTIPYKEKVMPFLDEIDEEALAIGAVNTVKFLEGNKLKGFNTDVYGFEYSILPFIKPMHKKALILGTGGASKAVSYALDKLGIEHKYVSREASRDNSIRYSELTKEIVNDHFIVVNCSPVGTFPDINACPNFPYNFVTKNHLFFDLIYNPSETLFLKKAKFYGAQIKNGEEMLELQAEKAWEIWNY